MNHPLINLLFNPTESFCVSPDKFAKKSINALSDTVYLQGNNSKSDKFQAVRASDLQFVCINPISGARTDDNVTAYRSFLLEFDTMSLEDQQKLIDNSELPWSARVFSGNKSYHYIITLDKDLPKEVWTFYYKWLLNIFPQADQSCKNPSRASRFGGNVRKDTGKTMNMIVKQRVSQDELDAFLSKSPDAKPSARKKREEKVNLDDLPPGFIPPVLKTLKLGYYHPAFQTGRNQGWFVTACQLAKYGYDEDQCFRALSPFFEEESDFTIDEFENCIKSAVKKVLQA